VDDWNDYLAIVVASVGWITLYLLFRARISDDKGVRNAFVLMGIGGIVAILGAGSSIVFSLDGLEWYLAWVATIVGLLCEFGPLFDASLRGGRIKRE
jgi:hypothetical protein